MSDQTTTPLKTVVRSINAKIQMEQLKSQILIMVNSCR